MALSKQQQIAVQITFSKIEANPDPFATAFYSHLFDQNQSLRKLFKTDLKEQGDVLVRMLTLAVAGLDHPDDLMPMLNDLGLHHAGYGVKEADYTTFGAILTQTLREFLATEYTNEVADAWSAFYDFIAAGSIEGRQD